MFLYSFGSFGWAETCWRLAKTVAPNYVHLVSSARREKQSLFWVQHLSSFHSPGGPHVHQIPMKKILVLWLRGMRHHVGCCNLLLFSYVNLRSLTFISFKCVVPTQVLMKNLSYLP